jgi:hypothetical protein
VTRERRRLVVGEIWTRATQLLQQRSFRLIETHSMQLRTVEVDESFLDFVKDWCGDTTANTREEYV